MSKPITVKFDGIGWAEAHSSQYEAYQESYEVCVYTNSADYAYDAIMKTISWGTQQGFTVLSKKGTKLESVTPDLALSGVKGVFLIKQFRFVKEYVKTLGGDEE